MSAISDADAIRAFLLDLLSEMASEMLKTDDGRRDFAGHFAVVAASAHTAAAKVMREAALKLRG